MTPLGAGDCSQSNLAGDTNYVTAIYLTYCQRYPDAGGLSYWVGVAGTQGRTAVRDAFAGSGGEFSARVSNLWGTSAGDSERTDAFVQYLYNAIVHRWASGSEDAAAISTFDNAGATGQGNVISTAGTWASGLFNSTEYTSRTGLTPHDFVYDLYQAFLRYAPDQAGWDYWTTQVGTSWQNKQSVMNAFINAGPYAQTAGTLYREVLWLTADHLGTPRLIAERTGSFAGMKRHDYLPFGEELFAGQGGRSQTQGYSTNDSVRQKFTSKERDSETGLDFFEARYYSSVQGRFTGIDPVFIAFERLADPQQQNLYAYVRNNPLVLTDPTGQTIEDAALNDNKKYQEWKAAFRATEEGKRLWDKYDGDKNFTLTMKWEEGENHAVTGDYKFKDGKLVGATMALGSKINEATARPENQYPAYRALTAAQVDGTTLALGVMAHEFGHLEDASQRPAFFQLHQEYNDLNKRFSEMGQKLFSDPTFVEKQQSLLKAGGYSSIAEMTLDLDHRAERQVVPVVQGRLSEKQLKSVNGRIDKILNPKKKG